jgi:hypothetical protein
VRKNSISSSGRRLSSGGAVQVCIEKEQGVHHKSIVSSTKYQEKYHFPKCMKRLRSHPCREEDAKVKPLKNIEKFLL